MTVKDQDRNICFYCEHCNHLGPKDDSCRKHHSRIFFDTPACNDFVLCCDPTKLTRSTELFDKYLSDDLGGSSSRAKLSMTEKQEISAFAAVMCFNYCKFSATCKTNDELELICAYCPVHELLEAADSMEVISDDK